mmetsp:Transcript_6443/g.17405  ORF Transcript_6443/g.17405 Transcript_6443/m.17405 type:complete len:323 (-) Transcript_6443:13-981(-)
MKKAARAKSRRLQSKKATDFHMETFSSKALRCRRAQMRSYQISRSSLVTVWLSSCWLGSRCSRVTLLTTSASTASSTRALMAFWMVLLLSSSSMVELGSSSSTVSSNFFSFSVFFPCFLRCSALAPLLATVWLVSVFSSSPMMTSWSVVLPTLSATETLGLLLLLAGGVALPEKMALCTFDPTAALATTSSTSFAVFSTTSSIAWVMFSLPSLANAVAGGVELSASDSGSLCSRNDARTCMSRRPYSSPSSLPPLAQSGKHPVVGSAPTRATSRHGSIALELTEGAGASSREWRECARRLIAGTADGRREEVPSPAAPCYGA